jgi:nicotinamide riboside kinase
MPLTPESAVPRLISIVGGESTGKSTLAAALGVQLPAVVVSEYLRTWVDQHRGRVPTAAEQSTVLAGQRAAEVYALSRAKQTGRQWVIADSGPLMTAVYSIQYYDDASLLSAAIEWVTQSEIVIWCKDDFPWQPDPQRDGSDARTKSQQILSTIFVEYPELPMLAANGPLSRRVQDVLARVGVSR